MNRFFLLIIVLFLLGSCMNRPVTSVREEVILDKPTFPNITVMGTFHKPLNEILNIQDWDIIDSSIVCLSSNRDTVFYKYDAKDFSFQKSFGIIGQGPEEYAFPSIVRHSGNLCIIDHGNMSFNTVSSNDMKHKLHDLKLSQPANYPLLYSDSLFCFVGNTPNAIFLYLYNLHTQSAVDSIAFEDERKGGKAMQYDFAYDLCGNNLVIAHLYIDQFSVYQVSEKGFEKQYQVNGSKNGAADKCYYSDVSCTPDGIMLLSNAHVDLKSLAGQSEIEYYSWDLTPLKMIKLDMIGDRLLRNVQDSLLWLHSPLDDDIYWSEF